MTEYDYIDEWQLGAPEDRVQAHLDLAEAQAMSVANAWVWVR